MALPVVHEGLPEERKLLTGIETPEALLGLKPACSRPPQPHPGIAPAFDIPTGLPHDTVH